MVALGNGDSFTERARVPSTYSMVMHAHFISQGGSSKRQAAAASDLRSRLAFDSAFEKMVRCLRNG